MRYLSISFAFLFAMSFPVRALADPVMVRAIDDTSTKTLARALEGSPLVRRLVQQIEASNVVVHIVSTRDLPTGIAGTTRFVVSRGGYRFLRINIAANLAEWDRAPILAHELQHVWEIARSDADDVGAIRKMLDATGYQTRDEFFETEMALEIERTVRRELRHWQLTARSASPSRSASPARSASPGK